MGPECRCQKRVLGPAEMYQSNFHNFHSVEYFHYYYNFHSGLKSYFSVEITETGTR